MSFHATTSDVQVHTQNGRTYLKGNAKKIDGTTAHTSIDLDNYLGNRDGRIDWDAQNFTATATEIRFAFEGADHVPVLRAKLKNGRGDWVETDKNLGERIQNKNGEFFYS